LEAQRVVRVVAQGVVVRVRVVTIWLVFFVGVEHSGLTAERRR
jgi:hypothetical protein